VHTDVIVDAAAGAVVLSVVIVPVLASVNVAAAAVVTDAVAGLLEHCGWSCCCCDSCIIWSPKAFITLTNASPQSNYFFPGIVWIKKGYVLWPPRWLELPLYPIA